MPQESLSTTNLWPTMNKTEKRRAILIAVGLHLADVLGLVALARFLDLSMLAVLGIGLAAMVIPDLGWIWFLPRLASIPQLYKTAILSYLSIPLFAAGLVAMADPQKERYGGAFVVAGLVVSLVRRKWMRRAIALLKGTDRQAEPSSGTQ